MSHSQLILFSILLLILIFLSAFFSAAETGLMAINRYRLRHKARMRKQAAIRILRLLKRPDRLLGLILIGNCFSNIVASALATVIAIHFFGEKGVFLSAFILTIVILIFAEVAPKTLAALYPDQISKWVSWPVLLLLKLFYPFVWLINAASNGLLKLFHVNTTAVSVEPLSREELRSVVYETSSRTSHQYQTMLLGILDLNKVTVNDVMVPRHEIIGIDLEKDWNTIQRAIMQSSHDWLPMYRESIQQVVGMLHLRELMHHVLTERLMNKETLIKMLHETYFVPENTPLNTQLLNFQREHKHVALVVDEYGEVLGLLTLVDILEEIVGEFATDATNTTKIIQMQADGSYLAEGSLTVREFNRITHWNLPTNGPRTLSGLIIEYLEAIPRAGISVLINHYPIEIVHAQENRVKVTRVFPRLHVDESGEDGGSVI